MTNENKLKQSWDTLSESTVDLIDWVANAKTTSKKLEVEADNLVIDLFRAQNMANKLGSVADKEVAVGFFGLSQAGKSYLISALAAGENGQLETTVNGETLNFIDHVNPPGGGKEATGLVTRFSRTAKPGSRDYPLVLKIFKEVEIAKILIDSFFKDFNQQKINYKPNLERLKNQIQSLKKKKSLDPISVFSSAEVVDLYDYIEENFGSTLEVLKGNYWDQVIYLIPYVSVEERAELLSVLWGEQESVKPLTSMYIRFAKILEEMGDAVEVHAPLSVIIKETENGKDQSDSIMNVDILNRLMSPENQTVSIQVIDVHGEKTKEMSLTLSELAFLTAELSFPLVNKTHVDTFEKVDLLDFPGYRGRMSIESLEKVSEDSLTPQLLLRGKVAYLFERYTDSQEMNVLIVCTPSDKQSDVNDVGPVLERWINKTQGATPEERSGKEPGLFWAITMFDKRIVADLDKKEDMLRMSWGKGGLLQQTILERFGGYDWLNHWNVQDNFKNVYLVRKPGFPVPFLEVSQGNETGINPNYADNLSLLKSTFIQNSDIQEYIDKPEERWNAMMELNDGGMRYMSGYLKRVAKKEIKSQRLKEQLNHKIADLVEKRFGSFYMADGDEGMAKLNIKLDEFKRNLSKMAYLLGEFLSNLVLPEHKIKSVYRSFSMDSTEEESEEEALETEMDDLFGDSFFTESSVETEKTNQSILRKSIFAQNVYKNWIEYLRSISVNPKINQYFKIEDKVLAFVIDELIIGSERSALQEKLNNVILENDRKSISLEKLEAIQAQTVAHLFSDYIAWLDCLPGTDGLPINPQAKTKIFASPLNENIDEENHELPKLNPVSQNYQRKFVLDWFTAFESLATNNIGHSAGREITQAQNAELGRVLTKLKQAQIN